MVENQQGVSTFLSFGAKSVKPHILEQMLIGRRENADFLEKCVKEIAQDGLNHQLMIVGKRGMGKTHLLRTLYHRSQPFLQAKAIEIAYFSEEEYGIANYLDFLIRILNAFMRWNDADRETLRLPMDGLRETHPNRQIDVAERIISDYVGQKPLLILAENFDSIMEALGKDGQAKLRSFLYTHSRTSIIATAQALSPDLGREDRPFFGFFTNIYLKKLTYEDSLELIGQLATLEKQQNVLDHLAGKGRAQVRAIHDLVKGNHRLLVTFYEFLKADTLATLSTIFIKTLNDLKPYYETYIRYLGAQQQKILHYIALAKTPQNGTEIAKNCFIDPKSLSKQLSELQRRGLLETLPDPTDGRNKLYDMAEPLLRISIEIGEHREGLSALFIDFLSLYYSFEELRQQHRRFQNLYESEPDPLRKEELLLDLNARTQAILHKEKWEADKKTQKAIELMQEKYNENDFESAINLAEHVPDSERDANYWFDLGYSFAELDQNDRAINAYLNAGIIDSCLYEVWYNIGIINDKESNYEKAIEAFKKTIEPVYIFMDNRTWMPQKEDLKTISKAINYILKHSKNPPLPPLNLPSPSSNI
ncbi:MAG: hypothetical protein MUE30_05270 [Spirosomaceae bacterium]|nr:hypothetical protein [Spirosomataceae bacterium]